ncbi:hypothetical protein [Paraflavitalea speifideaquila]|uniref:hypothetical protein n=1 Tax=Paraflavitalea speifideaquila TaxID=3076558 RepID=UPI0028EB24DB|nr:hypothetical protein [Paraflavitalea speifideiaquila]
MKIKLLIAIYILARANTFGQSIIDTNTINNWPKLQNPKLSNNANYFSYQLKSNNNTSNFLVVQSTKTNTSNHFQEYDDIFFTGDSQNALLQKKKIHYLSTVSKIKG